MSKNIILIGYRATGKTTVGQELATHLGLRFIDMDHEVEQRQGRSISEMVADQGWSYFRRLERELLEELLGWRDVVISTGGGVILNQDLWPRVKASGLVVWLTADRKTICQRLLGDDQTASQRPSLTGSDPFAEIAQVLAQREPLYRAGSHLEVDTGCLGLDEIISLIVNRVRELYPMTEGITGTTGIDE
ncbi:MAG: shikimate kinase [Proteobacteria bacterium]|nr:shikimate kinase [Desulfobulbaceae bacterium]MBU4154062.1 shikimate kinase [Pseudomonadota bacterium]MDP2107110.1 shikimate kinase [Desulfobulbaceae bacterium]